MLQSIQKHNALPGEFVASFAAIRIDVVVNWGQINFDFFVAGLLLKADQKIRYKAHAMGSAPRSFAFGSGWFLALSRQKLTT